MGFWSRLFGAEEKKSVKPKRPRVSRNSKAVQRLAAKRRVESTPVEDKSDFGGGFSSNDSDFDSKVSSSDFGSSGSDFGGGFDSGGGSDFGGGFND